MYGKISIYIAAFMYLILPFIYFIIHILKRYYGLSREIELLMHRILIVPVFSIPLLAIAILVLGYLSKTSHEGYGAMLNISIFFGILSLAIVFLAVYIYMKGGGSIGGIR